MSWDFLNMTMFHWHDMVTQHKGLFKDTMRIFHLCGFWMKAMVLTLPSVQRS